MSNIGKLIYCSFIFLCICGSIYCQRTHPLFHQGYFETHIFPSDSGDFVYYSYRIPYNRFVFVKEGEKYVAGFRISVEVKDSITNHITRQIDEKTISADKFDETNSNNIYYEGLSSFQLPLKNPDESLKNRNFHLSPSLTDLNSNQEMKLPDSWVNINSINKKNLLPPIIVSHIMVKCGEKLFYNLANFENCIPFSDEEYDLIVPSKDTSLKSISIILINESDTVFNGVINKFYKAGIIPEECNGNIILYNSDSVKSTKNFIVTNFSRSLKEGETRILISKTKSEDSKDAEPVLIDVVWFNKPFSLRNPEEAIKLLSFIEDKPVIDSLLSFDSNKYPEVLSNYWKKYNPLSKTEFNPYMNEYYSRIDYAMNNFSSLSNRNGAESDRGRIYIKYGAPRDIERTSDRYGKMVEKWTYNNPFREFEFVDLNGTGKYILKLK